MSPQKAYAQAEAECQTLDSRAHLAIITSQAEMDAIDDLLVPGQCHLNLMLYFGMVIIMCFGAVVTKPRLEKVTVLLTPRCQLRHPSAIVVNFSALNTRPSPVSVAHLYTEF